MIGEAIDWDVPWDFRDDDPYQVHSCVNTGGFDASRNLLYQQGYESSEDEDCQQNTDRFAGHALVESYLNGSLFAPVLYSGFVDELDALTGAGELIEGDLFLKMVQPGLQVTDSLEDLISVTCYYPNLDLGADDYFEVVNVLATVHEGSLADLQAAIDAGKAWYQSRGGMGMFEDADGNGRIDVCPGTCCTGTGDLNGDMAADPLDLVFLVNWFWKGGPGPECCASADLNCDCHVDPNDLNFLAGWLWRGWPWQCNACLMQCWEDIEGPPCP